MARGRFPHEYARIVSTLTYREGKFYCKPLRDWSEVCLGERVYTGYAHNFIGISKAEFMSTLSSKKPHSVSIFLWAYLEAKREKE